MISFPGYPTNVSARTNPLESISSGVFSADRLLGHPKKVIYCCHTDNTVMIYNRWGVLVFEREGYNQTNAFKGNSEGRVNVQQGDGLPEGTYWYILRYKNQSAGNVTEKAGYLYINR